MTANTLALIADVNTLLAGTTIAPIAIPAPVAPVKTVARKSVKNKVRVWEMTPEMRMARYQSQPAYWMGKPSKPQVKRVNDTAAEYGYEVNTLVTAIDAAEDYAYMMAAEKGTLETFGDIIDSI